ncbi:leucine-rich repeat-containing protein 73-like [Lineus longissimus]|uniref:leucine-rich repeat-containing protein 73-like n=1 Tax=Lineus longissimus TaxID=88925 RepID=UPI002B4F8155
MKPTSKSMIGTVQLCRETLTHLEAKDICSSLRSHNLRILSLRECDVQDEDFHQLMRGVSRCKSLLQLNLNVGVVTTPDRVAMLAKALNKNRSVTALFLHGSPLGDENMAVLMKALAAHPSMISLDLGDCELGDYGLEMICDLLPPDGAKSGLKELSLSGNPSITSRGWAKLFIAMSASSSMKAMYLDYNSLGNYGAGCLAVALASCKTVEIVDLECTGITEHGAQIILHLIQNFPNRLNNVNLTGNKIKARTLDKITRCLIGGSPGDKGDSPDSTGRMSESDQGEPPVTREQDELKSDAISLLVDALNQEDGSRKTVPMAQKQEQEGKNGDGSVSVEPGDEDEDGDEIEAERANVNCSAPQDLDESDESGMSSAAGTDDETDTDATFIVHEAEEIQMTNSGHLEDTASEFYTELEKKAKEQDSEEDDVDEGSGDLLREVPVPQQYDVIRTQIIVNRGSNGSYCMMHH